MLHFAAIAMLHPTASVAMECKQMHMVRWKLAKRMPKGQYVWNFTGLLIEAGPGKSNLKSGFMHSLLPECWGSDLSSLAYRVGSAQMGKV